MLLNSSKINLMRVKVKAQDNKDTSRPMATRPQGHPEPLGKPEPAAAVEAEAANRHRADP